MWTGVARSGHLPQIDLDLENLQYRKLKICLLVVDLYHQPEGVIVQTLYRLFPPNSSHQKVAPLWVADNCRGTLHERGPEFLNKAPPSLSTAQRY